ncbi:MAG: DUF5789 family protein [Halobacteriota archaeon]|uniref:DUF5789 family protein n=1 Tax=Natronomonas sp. TaxID=2184060 RepID=UPI0039762D70
MVEEVKLSRIEESLDELEYPIEQANAAAEFSEVTLLLADGEENLGDLISEIDSETFDSSTDIETALHNVLPREAVGEPYQSEGDA